jgi:hypothetical protein
MITLEIPIPVRRLKHVWVAWLSCNSSADALAMYVLSALRNKHASMQTCKHAKHAVFFLFISQMHEAEYTLEWGRSGWPHLESALHSNGTASASEPSRRPHSLSLFLSLSLYPRLSILSETCFMCLALPNTAPIHPSVHPCIQLASACMPRSCSHPLLTLTLFYPSVRACVRVQGLQVFCSRAWLGGTIKGDGRLHKMKMKINSENRRGFFFFWPVICLFCEPQPETWSRSTSLICSSQPSTHNDQSSSTLR